MEYSIQQLAQLAGVSSRTLRYYDQIGLLSPCRTSSSGYRIYSEQEVDLLQQILFYREMKLGLREIAKIVHDPNFNRLDALKCHLNRLTEEQQHTQMLIQTIQKTILKEEGKLKMNDREKFEGLKQKMVAENEQQYGTELREKFGDAVVNQSNQKMLSMNQQSYQQMQQMAEEMIAGVEKAVRNGESPEGENGRRLAKLHQKWLGFSWPIYSKEAHLELVDAYVEDIRFRQYYDRKIEGCAAFLRAAVKAYLK